MEPWVNALVRVGNSVVAALKKGPPKIKNSSVTEWKNGSWEAFNPVYLSQANAWKRFKEIWQKEGFGAAYNKGRMESVYRKGSLVGKDYNGNLYYEDNNAPYGRTRWVEYPTPKGVWAIEQSYDASMVSPEWHGWLHYTHDKPGSQMVEEFEKPFKMPHRVNQTMLRPEFTLPGNEEYRSESGFHQPPGSMGVRVERGRVGPKYESWSGSVQTTKPALRNYTDNEKTLHIP